MTAIDEPTTENRNGDPAVLEYMTKHPNMDYFAAEGHLKHDLMTAQQTAMRRRPAPAPKPEGWRVEPTLLEIQEAQRTFGLSVRDAEEKVRVELIADAQRLAQWRPDAAEEISQAIIAADSARQKADELILAHQGWIDDLKSRLGVLGNLRSRVRDIKTLALDTNTERKLAFQAFDYFLSKRAGGETTENISGWNTTTHELMVRAALNSHLTPYYEKIEAQAAEVAEELREIAKQRRFDLSRFVLLFLEDMRASEGSSYDVNLFRDLFDRPKSET